MNIITGYRNEEHIYPQDDRNINRGIFGPDVYISALADGDRLTATVISANEISIGAGLVVAQGCVAEVPHGTTESLTIANGSQGMQRRDLIVARYTKDAGTGIESMNLVVITGTPAAVSPALPTYTAGSIVGGASIADFPLYTVDISGLTIEDVERMVPVLETMADMSSQIESLESGVEGAQLIRHTFPFSISYAAGTIGTRGARETLTADYRETIGRSDLAIVGMYVDDFQASTNMQIELHTNGVIIYATAYRATAVAASNVSAKAVVTFMKVS